MSTALVPPPWTPTHREFYRFSVDQYHRMGQAGLKRPPGGVELLEGLIVLKWPPWGHTGWITDQYRFSVEEYHRLIEAGILKSGERFELLDGLLVKKMPPYPPHTTGVGKTRKRIEALTPPGWTLREEKPITLAASEPEPDVAIARGSDDDYSTRNPEPHDLGLVVEVSDSSLADDRGWKARAYAAAGVVEYWIVNLVDRQVEVMTGPTATGYSHTDVYPAGTAVPLRLDGMTVGTVAVDDLLP